MDAETLLDTFTSLTGRTRFRAQLLTGAVVLQVQYHTPVGRMPLWRDAKVEDLAELNHMVYSKIDVYLPDVEVEEFPGSVPVEGAPRGQKH